MINVLCIISNSAGWTGNKRVGGGELLTVEILKRWHHWGINVETLETNPSSSAILGAKYKVRAISLPLRGKSMLATLINILMFIAFCLRSARSINHEIDVIIASNSNLSNVIPAWFISKSLKKILIIGCNVQCYAASFKATFRKMRKIEGVINSLFMSLAAVLITFRLARSASAFLCLSKPIKKMLEEMGFSPKHIYVTGIGIDHNAVAAERKEDKEFDAVYLGRLVRGKGIEDLLDAWKIVIQSKPKAKLLILGDGPLLGYAGDYTKMVGMQDNIKFMGFVAPSKRFSYVKRGKIFVFPSKMEGFGISIAEAMACGLPVICYSNMREIYGNSPGILFVNMNDFEELAHKIVDILDNDESIIRLGSEARVEAKKFDWNSVAKYELKIVKRYAQSRRYTSRSQRQKEYYRISAL